MRLCQAFKGLHKAVQEHLKSCIRLYRALYTAIQDYIGPLEDQSSSDHFQHVLPDARDVSEGSAVKVTDCKPPFVDKYGDKTILAKKMFFLKASGLKHQDLLFLLRPLIDIGRQRIHRRTFLSNFQLVIPSPPEVMTNKLDDFISRGFTSIRV